MNKEYLLLNGNVITPSETIIGGGLKVTNGKISDILYPHQIKTYKKTNIIDAQAHNIMAGFIDQHLHGANGFDVMEGFQSILSIAESQLKFGVTSFCPTTIACPDDLLLSTIIDIDKAINEQSQVPKSTILGAHIEGPFLNEQKSGAHPKQYLQNPDVEKFLNFTKTAPNSIKVITLAPELMNAIDFISQASSQGIVISLGHSTADYETTLQAIKAGAKCFTHLFNAMSPFHHRNPGIVGAAFASETMMLELIGDGHLIHPIVAQTTIKTAGVDRVILVSDSLIPTGNNTIKKFWFGGRELYVNGGCSKLEDGTIWGSNTPLNKVASNIKKWLNLSLTDMSKLLSYNSAKLLGLSKQKGSITIGKDADIVICNDNFDVKLTIVNGIVGYTNQEFKSI